jgi:hypothetical protein
MNLHQYLASFWARGYRLPADLIVPGVIFVLNYGAHGLSLGIPGCFEYLGQCHNPELEL